MVVSVSIMMRRKKPIDQYEKEGRSGHSQKENPKLIQSKGSLDQRLVKHSKSSTISLTLT